MALYDLLIKHGTVVDPSQELHALRDVAISQGQVAVIDTDIPAWQAEQVVDATGLLVTPGLVDLHVHIHEGVSHYGIEPDSCFLAKGVTTALDAGSSGADTFVGLRKHVIETSATRLYALLHVSSMGMLSPLIGELEDMRWANVARCAETIEAHRDVLLGVKVRLSIGQVTTEATGMGPMMRAREAADAVCLPLMVHPQRAFFESLDPILALLKPGDILTHCFHGNQHGILDDEGNVRDAAWAAQARGVIFDLGHGAGSFSWQVADAALAQGFLPTTISSDLHTGSINGPVYDLPTTMTKFLHLGFSLDEVVRRVTVAPAGIIGKEEGMGTLTSGACADVALFELVDGEFPLVDAPGEKRTASQGLAHRMTVRAGRIVARNGQLCAG